MEEEATGRRVEAHRMGTLEAEQLDEALRGLERRDRQAIASAPEAPPPPALPERDLEFARLTAEYRRALEDIQRLGGFRQGVEGSLPWRILQGLRRPFGRSW